MSDDFRTGGGLVGVDRLLAQLLESRGSAGLLARMTVERHWPEIVGRTLAAHCRPLEVEGRRLIIAVPAPSWNATLRTMERKILQNLQTRCPQLKIEELRITLGRRPPERETAVADTPEPGVLAAIPVPPGVEQRVQQAVAAIDDPELRAQVASACRRQEQLRLWRLNQGWRPDPTTGELSPPGRPATPR